MTDPFDTAKGPLTDLRVIEMGTLIAGPFCGQLLGDLGAEVIKVEPPVTGDPMRQWGQQKVDGMSLWWPVIGRNKKSVTLNLREPEGQQIARDLVAKSDFLIENFRPGTMERWNVSYEQLKKDNPGLIMIRVSGYGQTGPLSKRAGFGAIAEAMGGLRYLCGDPSTPPSRVGISIGDSLAAAFSCIGALSALHHREKTGEGQVVDTAIYEAVLSMMESLVSAYDKTGHVFERHGAVLPKIAPSNVYPTKDGKSVLIAANQDTVFVRLTKAMGMSELATDLRFSTHTARGEHQAELDEIISRWSSSVTSFEIEQLMDSHGIPSGKIYTVPDMLVDPQFIAREAIASVPHPKLGQLRMQNVVPRLSGTPGRIRSPAPDLGAHNDEVYKGLLKMTDAQLDAHRRNRVI